jgi:hypothetical protein
VLLKTLAAPLTAYLGTRDEMLMVSGFTDDRPVRDSNRQFEDNWELSAQRALTVTRTLIEEESRPHPSLPPPSDPSSRWRPMPMPRGGRRTGGWRWRLCPNRPRGVQAPLGAGGGAP